MFACASSLTHSQFFPSHCNPTLLKTLSPCLCGTSTCVLPLSVCSLPLSPFHSFPSLFFPSPSTTCWAAAWRAWGAVRRPPAPTAQRTPLRRLCPPLHLTPSPTQRLRASRLPQQSPPTPITRARTTSRCPSSSPAPPSLPHGPWVLLLYQLCLYTKGHPLFPSFCLFTQRIWLFPTHSS